MPCAAAVQPPTRPPPAGIEAHGVDPEIIRACPNDNPPCHRRELANSSSDAGSLASPLWHGRAAPFHGTRCGNGRSVGCTAYLP